jgi:uncharacterized membrane protein YraQ (UPF0718 family)
VSDRPGLVLPRELPAGPAPDSGPRSRVLRTRALGALLLVALLVALRVAAPGSVDLAPALQDFLTLAISVLVESLPFVILGIAVSVVVQVWLPQSWLFAVLPRNPVLRRSALSLLGVLLPVCECGNVPLARGLLVRGLTVPDALTFLLAAPLLNPVTIIVTYQAFGFSDGILLWRVVGGFVIANLVGWLFSRHPAPEDLLLGRFRATCSPADHGHGPRSGRDEALGLFRTETGAMLPALVVGAAAAGAIQAFVSRDLLLVLGQHPLWSVLALIALAFVIAICSTVDAFFILSLGSSFTPGAVVAFLLFGPMIDVKMVVLLSTTFTRHALVVLTTVVALMCAAAGLAVNLAL